LGTGTHHAEPIHPRRHRIQTEKLTQSENPA
jgi:hypothetical protein